MGLGRGAFNTECAEFTEKRRRGTLTVSVSFVCESNEGVFARTEAVFAELGEPPGGLLEKFVD